MAYGEFNSCRFDDWPTKSGPSSSTQMAPPATRQKVYYNDPFFVAAWPAWHGSTDALRVLLEQYTAEPTQTTALDQRGFTLLNVACSSASVETVWFLLDSQPPLGTLSARDRWGGTALLSAAASLAYLKFEDADESADSYGWIRDRITRGEELTNFLLDRGACAQDVRRSGDDRQQQPFDTVLGLAVSQASYALVKRLLDEGADVYTAQQQAHHHFVGAGGFGGEKTALRDVTALHLGSFFWNVEGVKALLDHHADNRNSESTISHDITVLVSSCDSHGRLPLHWADAGYDRDECMLPDDEISSRLVSTFKLLLVGNPSAINVQDEQGATPLHYAIGSHAACGVSKHAELATRVLLEHGADASISDGKSHAVLHIIAYRSIQGEPINTALLDLLLAHGAKVNHTDKDGNTALMRPSSY